MKNELKQTLLAAKICLMILWPTCAWAATITFGESMANIPLLSWLMTVILSTVMGGTSLLHTMRNEYKERGQIDRLGLFISSHMLGSNAAGMLMFLGAEAFGFREYTPLAIGTAAFGGTWFLERWLKTFTNKVAPETTP